jgi:glutamyl-tRNA(Gln) amidotransferase subunit D
MDINSLPINTLVRLTTEKTSYEGTLMPSESNEIVIKLFSGYNIGLLKKNIIKIEQLSEAKKQKADHEKQSTKNKAQKTANKQEKTQLPHIMILHTGGTIASKVDYETGGVVAQFAPKELLALFPELGEVAHIDSELIGNMWSEDFRFAHFNIIAKKIYEHAKKGQEKFIVTSGTDMLHYLSAALSFMLKDVAVSVLIVGAQRSSDRGSSDAGMNLACAASFLAHQEFMGVYVCMHESSNDETCLILSGVNVRKMHSSRRDAFKPINNKPLARVNYANKKITLLEPFKALTGELPKKIFLLKEELKIGMIYAKPNMYPEEFTAYTTFDGLILMGTGLGQLPITKIDEHCAPHLAIKEAITMLAKKMPVAMSAQTIYGRINMNVYSPGRTLQEIGVIGNGSVMSPETAYIKLTYLISNYDKKSVRDAFMEDLVGELHENTSNKYQ